MHLPSNDEWVVKCADEDLCRMWPSDDPVHRQCIFSAVLTFREPNALTI